MLSADDSEVSNVPETPVAEAPVVETPAVEPQAEPEQPPVTTPEEPSIELDGQRLTATQIKEMKKAQEDRDKWQKANTQRAQELAEKERRLSKYALIDEAVQRNPNVLQTIFTPAPQVDLNADLQAHYNKRPADVFAPDYAQWEMQKDLLLSQRAEQRAEEKATARILETEAREHNERIGTEAEKKLRDKGRSVDEIMDIGRWVAENIKPRNGKYPQNAFEVAEKFLYGEEDSRSAKLEASRAAANSIQRAVPASGNGVSRNQEPKSPQDDEDSAFIDRIKDVH
jgi:hypothetical protein